jgi:hypothetical protein
MMKPSRLRAAAVNGLVLLTSLVAGTFLAEGLVRWLRPQQLIVPRPELYRPDNVFGWRHVENADTTINTGEGLVRIQTDARGYRIASELKSTNPPGPRILMLGDSFLEATAVQSDAVVSAVLARSLTSETGSTAVVDNTGVGGWDPNHYLLESKRALARDRYDLGIVMLYVGNDMMTTIADSYPARQPSLRHYLRLPRNLSWKEWIDAVLFPINDALETRSHLFQLAKNSLDAQLARVGLSARYFPDIFQLTERSSDRWDITTTICLSIEQEFRKHAIPVVFVLVPAPYQVDPAGFESQRVAFHIDPATVDLDQPNKLIGARFAAAGLHELDPLAPMRALKQKGESLYGSVDGHLNPNGHKVLAKLLLPEIHKALPGLRSALRASHEHN